MDRDLYKEIARRIRREKRARRAPGVEADAVAAPARPMKVARVLEVANRPEVPVGECQCRELMMGPAERRVRGVLESADAPFDADRRNEVFSSLIGLASFVGSSNSKFAILEGKLQNAQGEANEANARAREAEEGCRGYKEEAKELHKNAVRQAVRLGEAGKTMADLREKKDLAFQAAKVDIAATERRCKAEAREMEAGYQSKFRWLWDELKSAREELRNAHESRRWLQISLESSRNGLQEVLSQNEALRFREAELRSGGTQGNVQLLADELARERRRHDLAVGWFQNRQAVVAEENLKLQAQLKEAVRDVRRLTAINDDLVITNSEMDTRLAMAEERLGQGESEKLRTVHQAYDDGFEACRKLIRSLAPQYDAALADWAIAKRFNYRADDAAD